MYLSVEIARQTRQLPKTPDMMNTPKMGLAQYSGLEDWASTWDMILDQGTGYPPGRTMIFMRFQYTLYFNIIIL